MPSLLLSADSTQPANLVSPLVTPPQPQSCSVYTLSWQQLYKIHSCWINGGRFLPAIRLWCLNIIRPLTIGLHRDLVNKTPRLYAAHQGDLASVIALVNAGAAVNDGRRSENCNIDSNDNPLGRPSPFHRAAYGGHTDMYLSLTVHVARYEQALQGSTLTKSGLA